MNTDKNTGNNPKTRLHIQPERLADIGKYGTALTIRFVEQPKRGEHSLSALDIARSYDALPSMERDWLGEFVKSAWKRQEGTDEDRQEATARQERLDWLLHVLELAQNCLTWEEIFEYAGSKKADEEKLIAAVEAIHAWLESERERGQDRPEAEKKPVPPVQALLIDADGKLTDTQANRPPELIKAANDLLDSKKFGPCHHDTERIMPMSRPKIQDALNLYAPAYRHVGTPRHESVSVFLREKAAIELNLALEQELVISVMEGLTLAGLSDQARIDEICRLVIAGE